YKLKKGSSYRPENAHAGLPALRGSAIFALSKESTVSSVRGIADLVLNLNFIVFVILRSIPMTRQIFWDTQQYYVGTWCINQYYVSSIMRTLGILLITLQRYLTMCCQGSAAEQWTDSGNNRWILVITHWTLPFVYVLPVIGRDKILFNSPLTMDVVTPPGLITINSFVISQQEYIHCPYTSLRMKPIRKWQ
ncbi:hypothetical protein TELCIR_14705, partial [Teladorsagia circumcincta]